MEAGKATIQESVAHARELEVIHEERKKGYQLSATLVPTASTTSTIKKKHLLMPFASSAEDPQ